MTDVYIGAGHGRKPDGRYDPGATWGNLVENELAHRVVKVYAAALRRSGVEVRAESKSGNGHESDPNYIGSARIANQLGVRFADEVHFNAGGGTGVEVLVHPHMADRNKKACQAIAGGIADTLGLPVRRNKGLFETKGFGFISNTDMPAAIIEVGFLDHPTDRAAITRRGALARVGEAIARARCASLGAVYVPPGTRGGDGGDDDEEDGRTGWPLVGPPSATRAQALAWARSRGAAELFLSEVVPALWVAGRRLGIDPAVMVAQSALETGYGRFGGVIDASFCNPCGMKARDGGDDHDPKAHQRFPSWDAGARAHAAHLGAYSKRLTAAEAEALGSPRARFITKHTRDVEGLGGAWAPALDYGTRIRGLLDQFARLPHRRERPRLHVVKAGDTLFNIARVRLGDPSRWGEIAQLNGLSAPEGLRVGARLRLPARRE